MECLLCFNIFFLNLQQLKPLTTTYQDKRVGVRYSLRAWSVVCLNACLGLQVTPGELTQPTTTLTQPTQTWSTGNGTLVHTIGNTDKCVLIYILVWIGVQFIAGPVIQACLETGHGGYKIQVHFIIALHVVVGNYFGTIYWGLEKIMKIYWDKSRILTYNFS